MSKQFPYPFPERFRSRLMLHYRTRISGTEVQKKLPFRVLVLGNFRGQDAHGEDAQGKADPTSPVTALPLSERVVRSFRFGRSGARVDDFMAEILPYVDLGPGLVTTLNGQLQGLKLTGKAPASAPAGEKTKVKLTGEAQFVSTKTENGLCDVQSHVHLRLDTEVDLNALGTEVEVTLSCRGQARGYLTLPAKDEPVGVVAAIVNPTKIKLTFKRSEDTDGVIEAVPPAGPVAATAKRVLPFDSVDSFGPDEVVSNVPELQRLRVIRELLSGLRSEIRNAPELRAELKKVLQEKATELKALAGEMKSYEQLAIDWKPPQPPTS